MNVLHDYICFDYSLLQIKMILVAFLQGHSIQSYLLLGALRMCNSSKQVGDRPSAASSSRSARHGRLCENEEAKRRDAGNVSEKEQGNGR